MASESSALEKSTFCRPPPAPCGWSPDLPANTTPPSPRRGRVHDVLPSGTCRDRNQPGPTAERLASVSGSAVAGAREACAANDHTSARARRPVSSCLSAAPLSPPVTAPPAQGGWGPNGHLRQMPDALHNKKVVRFCAADGTWPVTRSRECSDSSWPIRRAAVNRRRHHPGSTTSRNDGRPRYGAAIFGASPAVT